MRRRLVGIVAAVVAAGLLAGAPLTAEEHQGKDHAGKSAWIWLGLVDAGKYGQSWDDAAALFRDAVSRDDWIKKVASVRQPLGKVVSRTLKSRKLVTTLPGAPDGHYLVMEFNTVFENKAAAVETVTPMQEANGGWRVSGYFIK